MLEWLWNLLFPPKCPGCRCYVEQPGRWCDECLDRVLRPHMLPLGLEMAEAFQGGIWALGIYEKELRDMLRSLKYQQRQSVLPGLHTLVTEGIAMMAEKGAGLPSDVLAVPVPLHKSKLAKRGFNQSQVIFEQPLTELGMSMADCLLRIRPTKPQYGLSAAERRENLHEVFQLAKGAPVKGRQVLLVDDIMTTGATLMECARVLQEAGAARITGLVAASGRR